MLGVPTSTLRYYEEIQLIRPAVRGVNGYRAFADDTIARLRFIASAKGVGIPLDEIRTLADAYELEDCSTVAHQVVEAVASRLEQTRARLAELSSLASQLEMVMDRLQTAPAAGPCGDDCPCLSLHS